MSIVPVFSDLLVVDQTDPAIFMLTAWASDMVAPRDFLPNGLASRAVLTIGTEKALRLGVLDGAFSVGGGGLGAGEGGVVDYSTDKLAWKKKALRI